MGTHLRDSPGGQRDRLPGGVDGLNCGHGLCQWPQGRGGNQRGRLAGAALQFVLSKVCLERKQTRKISLQAHPHAVSGSAGLAALLLLS